MQKLDFKNFQACAATLNFKQVPFTKVVTLDFTQSLYEVSFKTSHCDDFKTINLKDSTDWDKEEKENCPRNECSYDSKNCSQNDSAAVRSNN